MNSNERIYSKLKRQMSRSLEHHISLDVPYTREDDVMILEIINDAKILKAILTRSVEIDRKSFEAYISNAQVGLAYSNYYFMAETFYMLEDISDRKISFLLVARNKVQMFYETMENSA